MRIRRGRSPWPSRPPDAAAELGEAPDRVPAASPAAPPAPAADEAMVDGDGDGDGDDASGEQRCAARANEGSGFGEARDAAPVVTRANMEVDGSGIAGEDHSAVAAGGEVGGSGAQREAQALASVVSEVDGGCIPEQNQDAAAMAGSQPYTSCHGDQRWRDLLQLLQHNRERMVHWPSWPMWRALLSLVHDSPPNQVDPVQPITSGANDLEGTQAASPAPAPAPVPVADEAMVDVDTDRDGASGEQRCAAPANERSSLGEARDAAPVASKVMMEVDGGGIVGEERSAAPASGEVDGGSARWEAQGVAPVVSEVDGGCIPEQDREVASEEKMKEAGGREVNQELLVPAAAIPVREEVEECLVGRRVGRSTPQHGGILFGKVASCAGTTVVYNVVFEDGHDEDLGLPQLQELLMAEESSASGTKASCMKRKLDSLVSSGTASEVNGLAGTRQRVDTCEMSARPVMSHQSGPGLVTSKDAETSSSSSDCIEETPSDLSVPVQAVELPPSSGDIGVPEESISHLFSVYNFLRSFSVQLFLSPFGLDDFVSAVNCTAQNNLLDAVHVSLLQALRRHLETKSTKGSQDASNCLKYLDWTLLDALTWPTFLLEYLYVMRCIKNLGGQSFGRSLLAIEYYELPVAMKLRILQLLCDHVVDSEKLKSELEDREGYNEMEYEMDICVFPGAGSRAVLAGASKASSYKRINDLQNLETAPKVTNPETVAASASQDGNSDYCRICGMDGTLMCCDGCPWGYHSRCINLNKAVLPRGRWFCPECVVNKLGPTSSRIERGARGAQIFGIDMYGRLFLGLCNYLLVIGTSSDAESYTRYYNHYYVDKVLQILAFSDAYTDICRGIKAYNDTFESERSKIGEEAGAGHTPKCSMSMSFTPIKAGDGIISITSKDVRDNRTAAFDPRAYLNLYVHGKIAASAAANLAVITSNEGKMSAFKLDTNQRKKMAEENAQQLKAFSSIEVQFVWPRSEKKLMEVPRDRCGWCLACRSSAVGNKKACFLNVATANAAKGSARILSAFRLIRISDSHFASIVAYLANMEESLHSLLVGSLQGMQQKQRWNKQLLKASNCRAVVPLLLELESNIRGVAFSASWLKLIDEWPMESLGVSFGEYQKHGTGGRFRGNCLLASESHTVKYDHNNWTWWSRGNLSKRILHKGALLTPTIRKAARQGGKRRMAGLSYHEGSVLPRQTKQFAWRACVGLIQNSSQLALQVRYLDAHIRWKELIHPDQIPSYERNSDGDFSAFGNAVMCDKKIVDDKIRYALSFPNQKHLPIFATKNILEAEDNQNENKKLWFSENHVPLYKVREFELKAGYNLSPTAGMLDINRFTNFFTRVKTSTRDVFSYLFHKGDVYPCTSCKKDVLFRDVVKCSSCQGLDYRHALKSIDFAFFLIIFKKVIGNCHNECTSRSVGSKGGNTISDLICKLCLQKRKIMLTSYSTNSSYTQPQQTIDGQQQPKTAPRIIFSVASSHSAEPAVKVVAQTAAKAESFAKVDWPIVIPKAQPLMKVPVAKAQSFAKVAQPIANMKAQPLAKVGALPITNGFTQSIASVQAQPKPLAQVGALPTTDGLTQSIASVQAQPKPLAKVGALPITNWLTQSIASVQARSNTKTKSSKPKKLKRYRKVQMITYFGLVWKKNKNDSDKSEFRANDVILRSDDGVGSCIKPTCCLCEKTYSPDFLYIRCDKCRDWFHGDALQLEQEKIVELAGYRCCKCRRRAMPQCPHSDDYTQPGPEFSKQTAGTLSQSTMLPGD
ncbi:hypothetical protein ACP4OV_030464 [Aristida adscensionis]